MKGQRYHTVSTQLHKHYKPIIADTEELSKALIEVVSSLWCAILP